MLDKMAEGVFEEICRILSAQITCSCMRVLKYNLISPKLELCSENEIDIQSQRSRLHRNKLILFRKDGGIGVVK